MATFRSLKSPSLQQQQQKYRCKISHFLDLKVVGNPIIAIIAAEGSSSSSSSSSSYSYSYVLLSPWS